MFLEHLAYVTLQCRCVKSRLLLWIRVVGKVLCLFYPLCTFCLSRLHPFVSWAHTLLGPVVPLWGGGCQVCKTGSKDPNNQCAHIALVLCLDQFRVYGGSKDPNHQCIHIGSTHFAWTSCTTEPCCAHTCSAHTLLGPTCCTTWQCTHTDLWCTHCTWISQLLLASSL